MSITKKSYDVQHRSAARTLNRAAYCLGGSKIMKESFLMYLSFDEPAQLLNDEDRGKLWSAVFEYARTGQELPLPLPAKVAFAFIREHLKRDGQKYKNVCARNAANGRKGGRPKNPENPVGNLETQNNPDEPRKADTDSDSDTDSDTDSENTIHSGGEPPVTAFSFEQFWKEYGKPTDRAKCEAKYRKLSETDRELIKDRLPAYAAATPDTQYRKNPLTWLNGRCWQDEPAQPEERKCAL